MSIKPTNRDNKTPQSILRSSYCMNHQRPGSMNKPIPKSGKDVNRPSTTTGTANYYGNYFGLERSKTSCDVDFLRKLLAINKKQEMILNKKLASLLLQEEFGSQKEDIKDGRSKITDDCSLSTTSMADNSIRRSSDVNEKRYAYEKLPPEKPFVRKTTIVPLKQNQTQYDLNGRRIYYVDDEEESIVEEALMLNTSSLNSEIPKLSMNSSVDNNKPTIICNAVNKSKCNSISKPMAFSHQSNKKDCERRKSENSSEKGEIAADQSTFEKAFVFGKASTLPNDPIEDRQELNQGDCVRNIIVHCSEVPKDNTSWQAPRKVLKVWNFNEIPRNKSINRSITQDCSSTKQLAQEKNDNGVKLSKESRNRQLKTMGPQRLKKREGRSNTVC